MSATLQRLVVLGATGSIGVNTLDVVTRHPDRFEVLALSALHKIERVFEQCLRFRPRYAVVGSAAMATRLEQMLAKAGADTTVMAGIESLIGQVALHHHLRGTPKPPPAPEVPLPPSDWKAIRALAAILRVAEGLDRSHWGVVSDVRVSKRRDGGAVLELRTDGPDAALEVWEAGRRTELLAKLLGGEVRLRVVSRR